MRERERETERQADRQRESERGGREGRKERKEEVNPSSIDFFIDSRDLVAGRGLGNVAQNGLVHKAVLLLRLNHARALVSHAHDGFLDVNVALRA